MKIPHLIFALVITLFIVGCSNPDKKALVSFKPIVTFLESQTNSDGRAEFSDLSYNVEKSDSLVSPFIGLITFKEHYKSLAFTYTCKFAEQDGKWVHKSIDVQELHPAGEATPDENNSSAQISQLVIGTLRASLDGKLSGFLHCPKTISDNAFQ